MGRFVLGKIIAVTNQKGGVGKTTTAVNLSACVAALGKRVLLADIDPQGNATSGLGKAGQDGATLYDVLIGEAEAKDAIVETGFGTLDLIPTAIELAGAEIELVSMDNREKLLQECISGNPHPLPYIRVNYVVAQFDEFYETYPSVREGTPMYVVPEDRILIW